MIELEDIEVNGEARQRFTIDGMTTLIVPGNDPELAHELSWFNAKQAVASDLIQIHDIIYMDKQVRREDFTIHLPEAQPLLEELESRWPKYNYRKNPTNLVGQFEPHRAPYTNSSISWYDMEQPTGVLSDYSVPEGKYQTFGWYGLKFDLVTGSVLLKLVVDESSIPDSERPTLPDGYKFFAVIFDESGQVDPMVDCYVFASPYAMKKYCANVGAAYPFNSSDAERACWIWGIVYNSETLEVEHVKGYARYDS